MKRLTLALGAVLCLLCLAPGAPIAARDKWASVRSKNFVLVGNASEKEIRQVATRLEQFRDVFSRLLKKSNFASSIPTTVVVFKDFQTYQKFAPPNTAGYFQGGDDVNYIALSARIDEANDPFEIIFHEFVHLLIKDNIRNMPVWFNEGLAEYYSTFEIKDDDRKVWLGKVLSEHVFKLRGEKLIPLQTLFKVDQSSPFYNEKNKQTLFYAESWALVHYLLNNPQRQPQLGRFFNLILSGMDPDKAFPQAFETEYSTLEKELKEYVKRDSYPSQLAIFERKLEFNLEMQAAPLTEAEGEYYLGDLLTHLGALDEAEKHLKKALALDESLALAHASYGILEMRRGRFAEARRYLERAVTAGTGNYLVHYYYAFALSKEAFGASDSISQIEPELARRMRAELKTSIELNPGYANSYRLLAFVNLVTNEQLDESIALLKRAIQLLPGEPEFGYLLARAYLEKRDYKAARETLAPIAGSSSATKELREQAQSLLDSITEMEKSMARYAAEKARAASASQTQVNGSTQVVLSGPEEQGSVRTPEEALAEALDEALRKPQGGEERVRGQLLRIDCGARGIIFTVQTDGRLYKFSAADFEGVDFTSYTPGMSGQIQCGQRNPVYEVVVIYRPAKDAKAKADGQIISVEFVPKEYKLKQ